MHPQVLSATRAEEAQSIADRSASADDRELVERAKVDRDAFGLLYRRHAPEILRYLKRRTGDATLAEDLLAETFLRALKGIGRFKAKGIPVRFWLYRIATNAASSAARRRGWRALLLGARVADEAAPPVPEDRNEAGTRARAALSTLSQGDQTVLVLRFVEELSIDEVARVMGCPPGTVQSRTARARERLRRRLERTNER